MPRIRSTVTGNGKLNALTQCTYVCSYTDCSIITGYHENMLNEIETRFLLVCLPFKTLVSSSCFSVITTFWTDLPDLKSSKVDIKVDFLTMP